jgi:hypothetical protein
MTTIMILAFLMVFSINAHGQIENPLTDTRNYKSLKVEDEKKRLFFKKSRIIKSRNYKQSAKVGLAESYNLVLPKDTSLRNRKYKSPF